jgi:hypothetical protein
MLDGGNKPERGPSFPGAALLHKLARQFGIAGERCCQDNVPGSCNDESALLVAGFAIDRQDILDRESREYALLQKLSEFPAPTYDQYVSAFGD